MNKTSRIALPCIDCRQAARLWRYKKTSDPPQMKMKFKKGTAGNREDDIGRALPIRLRVAY
jgi:hypothetical protein